MINSKAYPATKYAKRRSRTQFAAQFDFYAQRFQKGVVEIV